MGALMREHDWSASPLGHPKSWPGTLRSAVNLILQSRIPMFVAWGPDLAFLYNDAYAEILGAKHPSALGTPFRAVWVDIWDDIGPLVERAMVGETTYSENLPLTMRRYGYDEETWFTFSYSPIYDERAAVGGMYCAVTETTGQVIAERSLRDGEARWRSVFERMHEGFCLCEMVHRDGVADDFRYIEVNAAWGRLTGVPPEATVGRLASEVFPGIEDIWARTYARVVETGEPAHFVKFLGPVQRWFEVLAYRTEPGRFAALFLNVTQRRAADEALRAEGIRLHLALEAGRLGSWELDVATDTARCSPRHDAIFGYAAPPPDWGYGRFNEKHVLPEDRDHVDRYFHAAAEGGADWHFECRIRRADDSEVRWIEARGQPVRDAEGRPVRLLGVVADVTERKRAEERQALLLAELSHRVKNSLAVVQALAIQTARGAADLPSFSAAFQSRLIALARAHDLLTRQNWEGAALDAVVRATVDPLGL